MSVQTNTSVQLTTPPINANTTPNQFLDQAIALETLKIMDKTINNGRWTWAVVGTVFFILSLDGMKRVIINLVDKSITYLCNMTCEQWSNVGSTIISPVKLIGRGISLPFRYTYKKFNPELKVKQPIPYQTYPLECSESLWKMLHLRPEFSFDSEIMSIKYVGNGNEMEQTERWRNMKIETSSFIVYFEGNIKIKFTIKSTTSGSTIKLFTKSEITSSQDNSIFKFDENLYNLKSDKRKQYLYNDYDKNSERIYDFKFDGLIIQVSTIYAIRIIPEQFISILYNIINIFIRVLYTEFKKGITTFFSFKRLSLYV